MIALQVVIDKEIIVEFLQLQLHKLLKFCKLTLSLCNVHARKCSANPTYIFNANLKISSGLKTT